MAVLEAVTVEDLASARFESMTKSRLVPPEVFFGLR